MAHTPSSPLKIGFIGGALNSAVGYTHFNAARLDGHFQVEAGCFSRDPGQNDTTASTYGIDNSRTHASWEELLEKEKTKLDAVVVLTPTPSHAEIVIEALNSGYAVICEKSLGISSQECQEIEKAVQKNNGFLAVTFNYSGYPMVRELRRMIQRKQLGEIQQIHIEMPQEGYLREAASPQDWRRKDYAIPTVSLDLGVHVHHLIDFLTLGASPQKILGDHASYGPFPGLIDNVYCIAHYEKNIRVKAWWGKTALGYRNGLLVRIFGTHGSATWQQTSPEILHISDSTGRHTTLERGGNDTQIANETRYNRFKPGHPSGFIEAFANLYTDFAQAILHGEQRRHSDDSFVFGAQQAAAGLSFLEALHESSLTQMWVEMNAKESLSNKEQS